MTPPEAQGPAAARVAERWMRDEQLVSTWWGAGRVIGYIVYDQGDEYWDDVLIVPTRPDKGRSSAKVFQCRPLGLKPGDSHA